VPELDSLHGRAAARPPLRAKRPPPRARREAELGLLLMARREEKMRRRWSLTSVARGKMAFF